MMNYATENAIEDQTYSELLHFMWELLTINGENYHEFGLTERNLVVFIQAIENIYLDNMSCNYPLVTKQHR